MGFKKTSSDNFKQTNYATSFYIESEVICRIIPTLENADFPYKKWMLVWVPVQGKPSKCFATTANLGNKCPVTNLHNIISKVIGNPEVLSKYENKEKILERIKHIAFKLNLQAFYVYNAVVFNPKTKNQQLGILYMKTTAHKSLSKLINEYLEDDIDPLDIESGIWFKLSKDIDASNGRVSYSAEKQMIKTKDEKGRIKEGLWEEPISIPIKEIEAKAVDLSSIYKITPDEEVRSYMNNFIAKEMDWNLFLEICSLAKGTI